MLKVAEHFAATDRHLDIADKVFGHSNIAKSDDGRAAMKRIIRWTGLQTRPEILHDIDREDSQDGSGDPSYRIAAQPISTQRINLYFTWIQNTELNGAEREAWLQGRRTHLNESLLTMDLERARVLLMTYGQAFDEKTPIDQRQRWSDVLLARWRAADDALSRTEKASFIDEMNRDPSMRPIV